MTCNLFPTTIIFIKAGFPFDLHLFVLIFFHFFILIIF